jgi:hypothetical protein
MIVSKKSVQIKRRWANIEKQMKADAIEDDKKPRLNEHGWRELRQNGPRMSFDQIKANRLLFGENKFVTAQSRKVKDYLKKLLLRNRNSHKFRSDLVYEKDGKEYIDEKKFNRKFYRSYLEFSSDAANYINYTKTYLKRLKNTKFKNASLFFIDRDATIFQHVGKIIGEREGFNKNQFNNVIIPRDVQGKIIENEIFAKIIDSLYRNSEKNLEGNPKNNRNPHNPFEEEKLLLKEIDKIVKSSPQLFEGFRKQMQIKLSKIAPEKPILLVETGYMGTTLKVTQLLLKYFFPERKIYTSLFFGANNTENYVDHIQSHSNPMGAKYLEAYWKFKNPVDSLTIAKNGGIDRKISRDYGDPQADLFYAKIFSLAMGNALIYEANGIDISSGFVGDYYRGRYSDRLAHLSRKEIIDS